LLGALGSGVAGPAPVLFLPYLSGERTPHDDPSLRGLFAGLAHEHGRDAMTHAVLDGVAFAFRDCLDALSAAGTEIAEADVIGGGSRSRLWVTILANALGIPLHRLEDGESGGAFGAARLARLAVTGEAPEAVCLPPRRVETIVPEPGTMSAYAEARGRWRALAGNPG
jgi:xylulokinase